MVSEAAGCYIQLYRQILQQCYDPFVLSDPIKHSKLFDQAKNALETAYLYIEQNTKSDKSEALMNNVMQIQVELASLSSTKSLLLHPYSYFSQQRDQQQLIKVLETYYQISERKKGAIDDIEKLYQYFKLVRHLTLCLQSLVEDRGSTDYNDLETIQQYLSKEFCSIIFVLC